MNGEAPSVAQPDDSPGTRALGELAAEYGTLVSSVCRRMIRHEETARDAAQQVWMEIVKAYPTFRGEAKVSTWIYAIARRVALAHARRERVYSLRFLGDYARTVEPEPPAGGGPDRALWVRETCDKCVTGILHCVDAETRLAHILRDIAGLEYCEIALILEKSEDGVRQMVSRSRKKTGAFLRDRCAIYHPEGDCRCRMARPVEAIDLPGEYRRIGTILRRAHFLRQAQELFPPKNFWLSLR